MARGSFDPNRDEPSPALNGRAKDPLLKQTDPRSSPQSKLIKEDEIHELTPLKKVDEGDEEEVKVVSQAPDGGYGWIIVIASFFCNFLVDGVAYSFAVYLIELQDYFKADKGKVAVIGSLLNGVYLCMGPISTALTNAYGFRRVIFSGAIIAAVAFVASAFATSIDFLIVSFGVFGGIGFGLIYSPAILCVCYYFDKKRAMAVGICVCGSGVGALAFPPLIQMVVDSYGWDGSMYILAGCILQVCIAGALMRTLEVEVVENVELRAPDSPRQTETYVRDGPLSDRPRSESHGSGPTNFRDLKHVAASGGRNRHMSDSAEPTSLELVKSRKYYSTHGIDVQTLEKGQVQHQYTRAQYTRYFSTPDISDDAARVRRKSIKEFSHPLDRKDVHVQGSLKHIPQGSRADAEAEAFLRQSQQSLYRRKAAETAAVDGTKPPPKKSWLPDALRVALLEMIDLSIYKNWVFLIFSLASFLGMIAFYIPFTFIPEFAILNYDVDKDTAVSLISAIGGANICGRIFWGWLSDRPRMDPLVIHNICVVLVGIVMGLIPFCPNFMTLVALCVVFGFFVSPFISLLSIILTSRIGLSQLPSAFGQSQFVRGIASTVGSPIGGALFAIRQNYTITMLAGAVEFLACAAIASIILIVEMLRRKKKASSAQSRPDVVA